MGRDIVKGDVPVLVLSVLAKGPGMGMRLRGAWSSRAPAPCK